MRKPPSSLIWTIGHSNHPFETFLELLKAHGVKQVFDVRTLPGSKKYPQFNKETLSKSLREKGIGYRHLKNLGGLRRPLPDSINQGWKNASFRGYADYMQTEAFEEHLGKLILSAQKKPSTIMCAEALPWRCHRSLIADALAVKGIEVRHIMSKTQAKLHVITNFSKIDGKRITYPSLI
jgi:uncharacterized protein (DUF488 family)